MSRRSLSPTASPLSDILQAETLTPQGCLTVDGLKYRGGVSLCRRPAASLPTRQPLRSLSSQCLSCNATCCYAAVARWGLRLGAATKKTGTQTVAIAKPLSLTQGPVSSASTQDTGMLAPHSQVGENRRHSTVLNRTLTLEI